MIVFDLKGGIVALRLGLFHSLRGASPQKFRQTNICAHAELLPMPTATASFIKV